MPSLAQLMEKIWAREVICRGPHLETPEYLDVILLFYCFCEFVCVHQSG